MSRHKPSAAERDERTAARLEIVQMANRYLIRSNRRRLARSRVPLPAARLLGPRHIQRAVFVCRQMPGLVTDETMAKAGFAVRRPVRTEMTAGGVARLFNVPLDMLVDVVARGDADRAA